LRIPLKRNGKTKLVEVSIKDGRTTLSIDGHPLHASAVEVAPGLYSILLEGKSFEAHAQQSGEDIVVTIEGRDFRFRDEDPREWQRGGSVLEAAGRQQVAASMPGKVIRVLVSVGQTVSAGQGLAVIEAMKMQNEVRSPKSGRVERLMVSEGQAVNAGQILAIVV
jgi:biotin carboxyl carrier protein